MNWNESEIALNELTRGLVLLHNQPKSELNEYVLQVLRDKCIEIGYVRYELLRPK